jgi:hypothetical protein
MTILDRDAPGPRTLLKRDSLRGYVTNGARQKSPRRWMAVSN